MDLKPLDLSQIATVEELQQRREDISNKARKSYCKSWGTRGKFLHEDFISQQHKFRN